MSDIAPADAAPRAERTMLRHELVASRTAPAVLVATIVLIVVVGAVVLAVWARFDAGLASAIGGIADRTIPVLDQPAARIALAVVLALVGLGLLLLAVVPGRRARRGQLRQGFAVVMDDGIVADALAGAVSSRCALPPEHVSVVLGRRRARVHLRPVSGVALDREAAADAAETAARALRVELSAVVSVSERGSVG
ncbi:hypothetical protein [uncultured Microbacterium sp.]|uniref:hypothetical protein n=1 Tax=uncultured Microbacterium sp. TaxID=191216 RepID=UPI0025D54208|nr:hypothetical protein [uncultured Microbacterium sp.]